MNQSGFQVDVSEIGRISVRSRLVFGGDSLRKKAV